MSQVIQVRFPHRATTWQLRTRTLDLSQPLPKLMGIINVTPDSFSDGGKFSEREAAVRHGLDLAEAGADLLDVGGESTRPYAAAVSVDEELDRVVPVVESLARQTALPISIDTSKSQVALAALEAGAEVLNDVTALAGDAEMVEVARQSGAGLCLMHMQGTPQTMQDDPRYEDVVAEVSDYLDQRLKVLEAGGIDRSHVCIDPGIGFGKTHEHNLELLQQVGSFHQLRAPVLIGHSRKGFLAKIIGDKETDRVHATVGVALAMATAGVQVVRVHDVAAVRQAFATFAAVGGLDR